jgi:hypothetical protein
MNNVFCKWGEWVLSVTHLQQSVTGFVNLTSERNVVMW